MLVGRDGRRYRLVAFTEGLYQDGVLRDQFRYEERHHLVLQVDVLPSAFNSIQVVHELLIVLLVLPSRATPIPESILDVSVRLVVSEEILRNPWS